MKSRDEAIEVLHEFTKSDSLRKHALAVEQAMRAYAVRNGQDPDRWGMAGLLHGLDGRGLGASWVRPRPVCLKRCTERRATWL